MPTRPPASRALARRRTRLAAVALATVGAFALGSCSAPAPSRSDIATALVDSGLPRKTSDCIAKALTTTLSDAELQEIVERGAGGAPVDDPKVSGESADELSAAMVKCRELMLTEAPTTTTTAPEAGSTSTTLAISLPEDGPVFNTTSTTTP